MKSQILMLAVSLPALALAACGEPETTTTTEDLAVTDMGVANDGAMMDDGAMMGDAAAMNADQFITNISASDAYEIAAGQLAQEKATSQPLRDFGAKMVEDHRASTNNLMQAASEAGMTVGEPQMTAEQQANLEALRSATGSEFDSAYESQQVAAHEQALSMLRSYADGGDVPALRTFASNTAPVVEGHLNMIRDM